MADHKHVHDENCDHEHEEMDTIVLTLDDDSEVECGVIGVFDVEDKTYIALLTMEDEQILLYHYIEDVDDEDEVTLEVIEDEDEFQTVSDAFYELYVDEEDSEDTE